DVVHRQCGAGDVEQAVDFGHGRADAPQRTHPSPQANEVLLDLFEPLRKVDSGGCHERRPTLRDLSIIVNQRRADYKLGRARTLTRGLQPLLLPSPPLRGERGLGVRGVGFAPSLRNPSPRWGEGRLNRITTNRSKAGKRAVPPSPTLILRFLCILFLHSLCSSSSSVFFPRPAGAGAPPCIPW